MPKVIVISTQGDIFKAVQTLNRMKNKLPSMCREGMRRWGKILERDMKYSAREAGIQDFSGTLQTTGIRYEQRPRGNQGTLFIRLYGIYLDSMAPHFVSIHRRRQRLLQWAKLARSTAVRRQARMVEKKEIKMFSVFVRPHPFIAQGYRRARPKLRPVLKRLANRAVESS